MALNAALQGMRSGEGKMRINPAMTTSFEKTALPVAVEKGLGIVAMKVFGQEDIIGPILPGEYSCATPFRCRFPFATVGVPKHEYLHANVKTAREFETDGQERHGGVFGEKRPRATNWLLDRRFRAHEDA